MRKTLSVILICLLAAFSLQAKHISKAEVLKKYPQCMLAYSTDAFYALNKDKGGFVILAADDCVPNLVLGYSDTGSFDPDNMPEAMKELLENLNEEVRLQTQSSKTLESLESLEPIEPLLSCQWNQSAPYNLLAPDGSPAGCVAVAMAQIMYKHKWPEKYDWSHILATYTAAATEAEQNAVAQLVYDCGISVNSKYTPSGTTANIAQVVPAFPDVFGYDRSLLHLQRSFYTKQEWRDLLYANLQRGLPIYYRGSSSDGGHAFVCDGYKDGLFHINWGWGGMSDGYFQIALLDPSEQGIGGSTSGYQFSQEAILDIQPDFGGEAACLMYCNGNFMSSNSNLNGSGNAYFTGIYENEAIDAMKVNLGIKLDAGEGNVHYLASSNQQNVSIPSGGRVSSMTIPFSDIVLTEGSYTITPVYQESGSEEWQDMKVKKTSVYQKVLASVDSEGRITFTSLKNDASLTVSSLAPRTRMLAGYDTDVDYTVKSDEGMFFNNVYVAYLGSGTSTVVSKSQKGFVDLAEGEEYSYTSAITNPVSAGSYDLVLLGEEGNILSDRVPVTVEDAPSGDLVLKGSLKATNTAIDDLEFDLSLHVTSGVFNSRISIYIYESLNSSEYVGCITGSSRTFIVEGDEAQDVMFHGSFPEFQVGKYYYAYAYYANPGWIQIANKRFKTTEATGIDEIEEAQKPQECYNLAGQRIDKPQRGIYVKDGKKIFIY